MHSRSAASPGSTMYVDFYPNDPAAQAMAGGRIYLRQLASPGTAEHPTRAPPAQSAALQSPRAAFRHRAHQPESVRQLAPTDSQQSPSSQITCSRDSWTDGFPVLTTGATGISSAVTSSGSVPGRGRHLQSVKQVFKFLSAYRWIGLQVESVIHVSVPKIVTPSHGWQKPVAHLRVQESHRRVNGNLSKGAPGGLPRKGRKRGVFSTFRANHPPTPGGMIINLAQTSILRSNILPQHRTIPPTHLAVPVARQIRPTLV